MFLVSGASGGIGRALAIEAAARGARVALMARNADKLAAVVEQITARGQSALAVPGDVRSDEDVGRVVATVTERFGAVDVLVNNAGKGFTGTVIETALEDYRDIFETNFMGCLRLTQAVLPSMIERRSGLLIQISSLNGFCAIPLASAYCASKFAMEALSDSLRIELRPDGIGVLVVQPGLTDTEFFDNARHFRERNPFPLQRMMSPETVAKKTLAAAAAGRRTLTLTADGKALWWMKKLSPRLVDLILARFVGKALAAAARRAGN